MNERFLKLAIEAARESGKIQLASLNRAKQIQFKGEINLVTEVDKRCERYIVQKIHKIFPDHEFLTEETGVIRKKGRSDFKWIIDPLDGTTNYSHNYPLFCTSIALEEKGGVIVGVVYEPNLGELFYAVRGKGAYLNGKRIRVSKISRLKRALLATGFSYDVQKVHDNNLNHFRDFIMTSQAVRRDGVAATDLCYLACGRFDGFWELGLWAWDVAAAGLILKEAGGRLTDFKGKPYNIYARQVVASNGKIHSAMLNILKHGA